MDIRYINRRLYHKYSSSQDYHFSSKIDRLMSAARTRLSVQYIDTMAYIEYYEYMKREYRYEEYEGKIVSLSEYYKYHRDVPRVFIRGVSDVREWYYEEVRRIEYGKVKAALMSEAKRKNQIVDIDEECREIKYTCVM